VTGELEIAKQLAIDAGAILRRHFANKTPVRWKGKGNPVTDADMEASRFIVESIQRRFPLDGILSEEESDNLDRLHRSRVWIIDPMDGTSEFVAGRTEFAVMIGLAVEGRPQMGVVYLPVDEKLYYAASGLGAFVESGTSRQALQVSPETDPSRVIMAVSRSHPSARLQQIREALSIGNVIAAGGVGLKVSMICEGRAHLYIHAGSGTCQWDSCAPEIILHEARGRMTDIRNRPLEYNTAAPQNVRGILASNGVLHNRALAAAARILKSSE